MTAAEAGKYFLTANITTWHPNQELQLSLNKAAAITVPMQYTVGWWNETQPVPVTLVKGANDFEFFRSSCRELVFKEFKLYKTEPNIPKPPANYTPVPPPPSPPPAAYIEVPASTNCTDQGILPVAAEDCSRACLTLGFKPDGPRVRPNISGCFVMTEGQYEGHCNYNSNASAQCDPPCTLYGAVVQSICVRK